MINFKISKFVEKGQKKGSKMKLIYMIVIIQQNISSAVLKCPFKV